VVGLDARLAARAGLALLTREQAAEPTRTPQQNVRVSASHDATITHWNATTLVYLLGVIEGHIAALLPALHDVAAESFNERRRGVRTLMRKQDRELREAGTAGEKIHVLREFTASLVEHLMPPPSRTLPRNLPTVERWERALAGIFFGPPPDRPLPTDLRDTLNEFGEVRNVLLHRLGTVDDRLLKVTVAGPWRHVGERVVINDDLYRRYVAALYAYSQELTDRLLIRLDAQPRYDIAAWRDMVPAGG
jgi:hypothetical protein